MQGQIVWWTPTKKCGIVEVCDETTGIVQKYFLLFSRIASSPREIKDGQYCRFEAFSKPLKVGLLPMVVAGDISNTPFEAKPAEAV